MATVLTLLDYDSDSDFSDDIYGRDVEIFFRKRWRDEHKFENSALLIEQLKRDEVEIKRYLQP